MGITLKELALKAGVSEATVSLAMNNRPGVKAETRDYIQKLAEEYGYIPSQNAQSLALKKSGLIGMIVPNITNSNYAALVELTENLLRKQGYHLIVATSRSDYHYECDMIKQFISFRVEGVILYPSIKYNPDPAYVSLLNSYNIPFVYLGGYYREVDGPVCMDDYYESVRQITNMLIDSGCKRVCLVSGDKTIVSNTLRHAGARDALHARGLPFSSEDHIQLEQTDYDQAYTVFSSCMEGEFHYDGVIAVNTLASLGIYNAAIEHGYRVPQDLSIVAGDYTLPQKACCIPLSGITFDREVLVQTAVEMLMSQLHGEDLKGRYVTIAPTFVPGASAR